MSELLPVLIFILLIGGFIYTLLCIWDIPEILRTQQQMRDLMKANVECHRAILELMISKEGEE